MAFPGEMSTLKDLFGNPRLIEIKPRHLGCGGMRCGHAMYVHLTNPLALNAAAGREEATRSRQSARSCRRAQNRGKHTVEARQCPSRVRKNLRDKLSLRLKQVARCVPRMLFLVMSKAQLYLPAAASTPTAGSCFNIG